MTTINKEEIQKFSKMADEWWDANGKFKPLHVFNPIRIQYIKEKCISYFKLKENEIREVELSLCPTGGTCMVMGTASTMACLTATLGLMLPDGATPLSGSADRLRQAVKSGRQIVELVKTKEVPKKFLSKAAFYNSAIVLAALGGSTNAVIHLIAIARRAGVASVKMSRPVMLAFAWPCLPVLDVVMLMILHGLPLSMANMPGVGAYIRRET